jgi:hypothetical protein
LLSAAASASTIAGQGCHQALPTAQMLSDAIPVVGVGAWDTKLQLGGVEQTATTTVAALLNPSSFRD